MNGLISVKHYYNNGYRAVLLNASNPYVGISSSSVGNNQGVFTCKFTRDNSNIDTPGYFDINENSAFIQVAYGSGKSNF